MKELRTEIEFEATPEEVWEVLADLPADCVLLLRVAVC
jgi:hypothetical protein